MNAFAFLFPITYLLYFLALRRLVFKQQPWQRLWDVLGGATALTAALDWLLLALLPWLGLSFGPVLPGSLLFNGGRLFLFLVILGGLWIAHSKHWQTALAWSGAAGQLLLLGLAAYALYLEPFHLDVTHLSLNEAPALLPNRPLRILHLTDLHIERLTRREVQALHLVAKFQPDIIVLTGDYINIDYLRDPQAQAETRRFLAALEAPLGVYAINGTTDPPWLMEILFHNLDNIHILDDSFVSLSLPGGKLTLLGLSWSGDTDFDRQRLRQLMKSLPASDYTLLLYHTPDVIETTSALAIDLYLAGHTHGGQVRLPFYGALVTFSEYGKRYEMGRYQVGQTTLYVSRGLGMEGLLLPRLRFLCPPEMTLVELGH